PDPGSCLAPPARLRGSPCCLRLDPVDFGQLVQERQKSCTVLASTSPDGILLGRLKLEGEPRSTDDFLQISRPVFEDSWLARGINPFGFQAVDSFRKFEQPRC